MAYVDKSGHVRSSANPSSVVGFAFPKLPRATTYYNPTSSNYTTKNPNDYITDVLGFLPVNTKYLSNTTNGFAMNSFADAFFNKEAIKKRWDGTPLDVDNPLGAIVQSIPLLGGLINSVDVAWNTIVDPVVGSVKMALEKPNDNFNFWDGLSAGLSTAAINSLVNIGNTLDVVANPVKGAVIESIWGDGFFTGLRRGAVGDAQYGRKQYDWADYVDNGLLAFGLEIISDPINWFSFGTKQVAASSAKAMANTLDDVADTVLDVAKIGIKESIEEAPEAVTKRAGKIITKHVDDTAKTVYKYTLNNGEDAVPVIKQSLLDKTGKEFSDEMITNYLHSVVDGDTVSDVLIKSTLNGTKKMITRIAKQHIVNPYDLIKKQDISKNLLRVRKPVDLPNNYGEIMADALRKNKRLRSGAFGIFGESAPPAVQSFYANQIADLTLKDLPKFAHYAKAYNVVNYLDDNIRNFALIGTGIYPAYKGGVKAAKYIKGIQSTKYASKMLRQAIEKTADWLLPERLEYKVDFNKTADVKAVELPNGVDLSDHIILPKADIDTVVKINNTIDHQIQGLHRVLTTETFDTVKLSKQYNQHIRTLDELIRRDEYLKSKGIKTFSEYVDYFKSLNSSDYSYNAYLTKLENTLKRYTTTPTELDVFAINAFGQDFLKNYSNRTVGSNLEKFLNDDVGFMREGVEPWLKNKVDVEAHKKNRIKHAPVSALDVNADHEGIIAQYTNAIFDTFLKDEKDPLKGAEQFFKEIAAELDRFGSEYGSGKAESLFKDDLLQECYSKFMLVLESFSKVDFKYIKQAEGIPDATFKKYEELVSEYFNFLRQLDNHISFKNADDTLDATQVTNGLGETLLKNTTTDKGAVANIGTAIKKLPYYQTLKTVDIADRLKVLLQDWAQPNSIVKQQLLKHLDTIEAKAVSHSLDEFTKYYDKLEALEEGIGRITDNDDGLLEIVNSLRATSIEMFTNTSYSAKDVRLAIESLPLYKDLDNYDTYVGGFSDIDEIIKHDIWGYAPTVSRYNLIRHFEDGNKNASRIAFLFKDWRSQKSQIRTFLNHLSDLDAKSGNPIYQQTIEDVTRFFNRGTSYIKLDREIRKLLIAYGVDRNLRDAFLDAFLTRGVQNTYNLQPDKILKTIEECFNNAEQNMRGLLNKPKLNQSYVAYKTAEQVIRNHKKASKRTLAAELIENLSHAHDALSDIENWSVAFLQLNYEKLELLRNICDKHNGTAIAFDLESTALLDYKTKEIFQLSAGVINTADGTLQNTKLYRIKVSGKNLPDPMILQTFYDAATAEEKAVLEAVTPESWFRSVYVDCNHPFYLDGTWEPALTEKQALKNFYTDFVEPNPKNTIFAGHNVAAFDSEFLMSNPDVCPELTAAFKDAKQTERFFDTYVIDYNKTPIRFDIGTRDQLRTGILNAINKSHLADALTKEPIINMRQIRALSDLKHLALDLNFEAPILSVKELKTPEMQAGLNAYRAYRAKAVKCTVEIDNVVEKYGDIILDSSVDDIFKTLVSSNKNKIKRLYSCINEYYEAVYVYYHLVFKNAGLPNTDAIITQYTDLITKHAIALGKSTDAEKAEAIYEYINAVERFMNTATKRQEYAQQKQADRVRTSVKLTQESQRAIAPESVDKVITEEVNRRLKEYKLDQSFSDLVMNKTIEETYFEFTHSDRGIPSFIDLSGGSSRYNPLAQYFEEGISEVLDDFNLASTLNTAQNIKRVSKADYGSKYLVSLYNDGIIDVPGFQNILSILIQRTAGHGQSPFSVKTLFNKNFANYFDPELIKKTSKTVNEEGVPLIRNTLLHELKQMADGIARVRKNISDELADAAYEDACEILKVLANDTIRRRVHHADLLYKNLYETADRKANTVAAAFYLQKNIALIDNNNLSFDELFNSLDDTQKYSLSNLTTTTKNAVLYEMHPARVTPELLAKAEHFRSYNSLFEYYGGVNAERLKSSFKMGTVDDAGTFTSWLTTEYGTYDDFYKMNKLTKEHIFEEMTEYYDQHHIFNAVKNAKVGIFRELEKNLGWLRDYLNDKTHLERTRIITQLRVLEKARTAGALHDFLNRENRVEMFIREAHFSAGRKLLASENTLDLSDFKKAGVAVHHVEAVLQEGSEYERTVHLYFLMVSNKLMDNAEALPEDWFDAKAFTNLDVDKNVLKLHNDIFRHLGGFVQGLHYSNGSVLTKDKVVSFDSFVPDSMRVAPTVAELEALETSEVEIVRQGLRKKEVVKTENFFSTLRADNMIIGDVDVQRIFDPYTAVNIVRRYAQTMTTYVNKHIDGVTLYYNLIANEATNINTNPMFKQLADKPLDFLEVWKAQDEYVAVYLEASNHTKTGIRVREFTIVNEKSVEVAKELNVCIIPKTQYYEVVQTVNQFKLPALFEVLREVSSFYKIGYLTSVGWVLRNIIDSNYKNHADFKDTVNIITQVKDLLSTVKLVQNYNTLNLRYGKAFDNMSEYYVFWHYFNDTPEAFAEYISKTPKRQFYSEKIIEAFEGKDDVIAEVKKSLIAPELFNMTDLFIKNGPSAGISRHLIDTTGKNIKPSQAVSSFGPVRCVMDFNTMVEQSARLQHYLYDIQRGASMDEAVANVIKTHFDYADKSLAMLYTEIVFPFMSFSFKNLKYWLESICESGAMTSELAKLLRTVLQYNNLFDADYDVYRNYDYSFDFEKDVLGFESNQPWQLINAARLYHLLSGNIVRDTGKDVKYNNGREVVDADLYRVFKLSPSIMDAVSMLFTPLNQFEQRMLPPYEVLLHCVQSAFNEGTSLQEDLSINGMLNNLPFVGAILQRTGYGIDGPVKDNNIKKRIEDDGIWQAVSSLFTAAYVPHKKYNTWYGADNQYLTQLPQYEYAKSPYYYSRLGGFKMNYTMTRYRNSYYNPNASRYRIESLAHSPYYKSPYSASKRSSLRTAYYSSLTYNALTDNLLKKRVLDKYRYL